MQSFFLIKPDAFPYRQQILKIIQQKELSIISQTEFMLSLDQAMELFPYSAYLENYDAFIEYLCEGKTVSGIVDGENSIERLLNLAGKRTLPEECEPDTIRRRFGKGIGKTSSGQMVVRNAIHRSKSEVQAIREMLWYQKQIPRRT